MNNRVAKPHPKCLHREQLGHNLIESKRCEPGKDLRSCTQLSTWESRRRILLQRFDAAIHSSLTLNHYLEYSKEATFASWARSHFSRASVWDKTSPINCTKPSARFSPSLGAIGGQCDDQTVPPFKTGDRVRVYDTIESEAQLHSAAYDYFAHYTTCELGIKRKVMGYTLRFAHMVGTPSHMDPIVYEKPLYKDTAPEAGTVQVR